MDRYRLYAVSESPYCQSVKGQLLRLGLPHDTTLLDWEELRSSEEVRALNPKGQVPVLQQLGTGPRAPLSDSLLITAALEERRRPADDRNEGPWIESRDAQLFRTADVELRDAMLGLYRLVKKSPPVTEEAVAARGQLARAVELVGLFLPRSVGGRSGPNPYAPEPNDGEERALAQAVVAGAAESAGTLHAAFVLDAAMGLASRVGIGADADVRAMHDRLVAQPTVLRVFEAFGVRSRGGRP